MLFTKSQSPAGAAYQRWADLQASLQGDSDIDVWDELTENEQQLLCDYGTHPGHYDCVVPVAPRTLFELGKTLTGEVALPIGRRPMTFSEWVATMKNLSPFSNPVVMHDPESCPNLDDWTGRQI